eukprot:jgi/Orpsp1_1/1174769/evm.model.c7180000051332.1
MNDYIENNDNRFYIDDCSIYDKTLEKAKPMQFPYNTFGEITEFEDKTPITLLLAHLYYDYYKPGEESFEDIVNECCDLMDESFTPECKNHNNIQFKISNCIENDITRNITYLNCKVTEKKMTTHINCNYIPFKNKYGYFIMIITLFAILIKLFFFAVVAFNRKDSYVKVSGFRFLTSLIISSLIIDISVGFWIGDFKKYK